MRQGHDMPDRNQRLCADLFSIPEFLKTLLCCLSLWALPSPAAPKEPKVETTRQITFGRWFSEPLRPIRSPTELENEALLQGLSKFGARKERDDFSGLTKFLTEHPDSVWAAALLTNLG